MEYDLLSKSQKTPLKESRLIVGSFPTFALTEGDKSQVNEKRELREANGDIPYYYGTSVNQFWNWYQKYVDANIDAKELASIEKSLSERQIGITNVIISAKRKGKSNFDYDLYNREYRRDFFKIPGKGETLKILCTSKEVLHGMLFTPGYLKSQPELFHDHDESKLFESSYIQSLNASTPPSKPISKILITKAGGRIECIAIPSPGSPFRTLRYYGFNNRFSTKGFLNRYLEQTFEWFLT